MLHELEQTLLPYLGHKRDIGVFVSGGLDSAVLLALCAHLKQKYSLPVVLQTFTVPQGLDAHWSEQVINWVEVRYQLRFDRTLLGNTKLPHDQRVLDALRTAREFCDHLLLADTTNPTALPPGPRRERSQSIRYIQPFFDLTKDRVVELGIQLKLEELMAISNSCNLDSNCGHCWACQERAWAFGMVAIAGIEPATRGV